MKKNEANNIQYSRSAKIMKRIIWMLCILLVLSGAGLAIVSAAPQPANKKSRVNYGILKVLYRSKTRYQNKTARNVGLKKDIK
ncbi:MAG: hypothetical protein ACLVC5_05710 [Clostridia bacterium]